MRLGFPVPTVYIVPLERFCQELGPALGVNLTKFEFLAYLNFFVQRKRYTLVLDSVNMEQDIRKVLSKTLRGLARFRSKCKVARSKRKRVSRGGRRHVSGYVGGGGAVSGAVSRYLVQALFLIDLDNCMSSLVGGSVRSCLVVCRAPPEAVCVC